MRVKVLLAALLIAVLTVFASAAYAQDITTQVVGNNSPVPDGQYEFVAAIMDGANPETRTYCTGSLIDPTTVITAGHCAKGISAAEMKVAVGKANLANDSQGVIRQVAEKRIHPRYGEVCGSCFDVAVLNFENSVPYRPADIAPDTLDVPKSNAIIAGYGSVDQNGYIYRDRMQKGTVQLYSDDRSKNLWGPQFVKALMIGALGSDGTDTCYGDSGGPLFKMVNGKAEVLGATSFGSARCGASNKPGVYTELNAPQVEAFIVDAAK
jgi:secreted trypsin-like serine protease